MTRFPARDATPSAVRRTTTASALSAATLLALSGLTGAASSASASLTGPGVDAGQNITVFHDVDFVGVFGYGPIGTTVSVDVLRAGVRIGTASGPTVDTPEGPGLEVNHGPVGTAQPGDCWTGTTPDIRPGDRIVVRESSATGADTDEVTVDDVRWTGRPVQDPATGDVLVRGVAKRADGTAIAPAQLDSGEFRDNNGDLRMSPSSVQATAGVTGGFTVRYSAPFTVDRNRANLTQAQIASALLTQDGHMTGFGHLAPLQRESMLIDSLTDRPGPALGCEASPAATGTTPATPTTPTPTADTTAPTITGRTPAAGATNVARATRATVIFDEPVSGVSSNTMQLRDAKGTTTPATVGYDVTSRTATLTPATALRPRTDYTVSLSGAITDTAGNRLVATTWSFTAANK